ncbi:short-chain dehydrogenase [Flavobacteriales bacterium 34_180_T64]|nr:short-chain dehydrogenase [Flavobacteriales bacterium 34_180_T64]
MKKTALITGASSGIGREFARIHSEKGGNIIIIARGKEKLEQLKFELESKYANTVLVIVKDLSRVNAATEIYNEVKAHNITVDYLINNAGFGGHGKFHERALEQDLAMINVNIIALTALTRLFLPDFVKRNSGKVLNVSSTASLMPGPLQAVYYATKAYVTFFSNAIAEELHDTKITVTALLPGATETEFGKTSGMDKTSLLDNSFSPYIVALEGYNGMLKGKLDVLSGLTSMQRLMMALVPVTPKRTIMKQIRKLQELKK